MEELERDFDKIKEDIRRAAFEERIPADRATYLDNKLEALRRRTMESIVLPPNHRDPDPEPITFDKRSVNGAQDEIQEQGREDGDPSDEEISQDQEQASGSEAESTETEAESTESEGDADAGDVDAD